MQDAFWPQFMTVNVSLLFYVGHFITNEAFYHTRIFIIVLKWVNTVLVKKASNVFIYFLELTNLSLIYKVMKTSSWLCLQLKSCPFSNSSFSPLPFFPTHSVTIVRCSWGLCVSSACWQHHSCVPPRVYGIFTLRSTWEVPDPKVKEERDLL